MCLNVSIVNQIPQKLETISITSTYTSCTWLNMPPKQGFWTVYPDHSYTEQEIIKLNRLREGRPHTDNTRYEDLTDAEKHEVDGLKKAIKDIQEMNYLK